MNVDVKAREIALFAVVALVMAGLLGLLLTRALDVVYGLWQFARWLRRRRGPSRGSPPCITAGALAAASAAAFAISFIPWRPAGLAAGWGTVVVTTATALAVATGRRSSRSRARWHLAAWAAVAAAVAGSISVTSTNPVWEVSVVRPWVVTLAREALHGTQVKLPAITASPSTTPTAAATPAPAVGCPPDVQIREKFDALFASKIRASQFYLAWSATNCPTIGAPTQHVHHANHVDVLPLQRGRAGAAYVVGNDNCSAVLFPDFSRLLLQQQNQIACVRDRFSWGFGTAQAADLDDGSCSLFVRYEQTPAVELDRAISRVIVDRAYQQGGFPWVTHATGTHTYAVQLVAPAADGSGYHSLGRFLVTLTRGTLFVDGKPSPAQSECFTDDELAALTDRGRQLDEALHRASAGPSPSANASHTNGS